MLFQWLQRSYALPGTPKHEFSSNFWNFMKLSWMSWIFMKLLIFYSNLGFASSLECQAAQPLLFPKGNQGFVKGCGWLKTQNFMIFIRNYGISGNFMIFHKFIWILCISQDFGPAALARKKDSNSYAFSMVAAPSFSPRHPKNWNFMNFCEISWNFMKIQEIWWS